MPYIKKLYLEGFKSFAKPTEILFDKGLNAIVGPNGSGKSNITDALCFVLGRLKVKSLRANKAANLIYHGGKNGKPSQKAKVSIVFNNNDKVFGLQGSEVEITRIVKKDGISHYKINGQTKTRQEILELLAQAGIDSEGFNIILQAEISQTIRMRPEEKRKIIEDVAGISIYEERKAKAFKELEKTEAKLKEIRTVLNERAAYLRNLEKEKAQAEKYEKIKRAIRKDKALLIFKKTKAKRNESEKLKKRINDKKNLLNKINEKINSIQNKINNFNNQIKEISEHIEKKSGVEQEDLFKEISKLRSEVAVLDVKIENYKEQAHTIDKRIEQLKIDEVRTSQELKGLELEKSRKKEKKYSLNTQEFKIEVLKMASQIKEESESLKKNLSGLFEKLRQRKTAIDDLARQNKIKEVREEINALVYSIESAISELNKISEKMNIAVSKTSKLKIGNEEEENVRNVFLEIELAKKELDRIGGIIKKSSQEKLNIEKLIEELKKENEKKKKMINEKEKIEKKLRSSFEKLLLKKSQLQGLIKKHEIMLQTEKSKEKEIENETNTLSIMKARVDAELEAILVDMNEYNDISKEFENIKDTKSATEIEERIKRNEKAFNEIGYVNLKSLEVYDKVKVEYEGIESRADKIEKEKQEILKIIEEVDKKKKQTFMQAFNAINNSFSENFMALSNKGQAFLELEDKKDPFDGGLNIMIKLAKGKYMDADQLSGGEKVIVALSLIFAIQKYKPYCFYVFDEIDPALDKRNSERLASILRKNVQKSQCIIITHNDSIINQADVLYGATMQDGISKIIGLKI